jgi:RNA recognition motif-containing protein
MSVRLFVGNLPYDVTESDLRDFFMPVGQLSAVIIPTDRNTGKPRGFAFVEFSDQAQADEAVRRFNNQPLNGRNIAINEAPAPAKIRAASIRAASIRAARIRVPVLYRSHLRAMRNSISIPWKAPVLRGPKGGSGISGATESLPGKRSCAPDPGGNLPEGKGRSGNAAAANFSATPMTMMTSTMMQTTSANGEPGQRIYALIP